MKSGLQGEEGHTDQNFTEVLLSLCFSLPLILLVKLFPAFQRSEYSFIHLIHIPWTPTMCQAWGIWWGTGQTEWGPLEVHIPVGKTHHKGIPSDLNATEVKSRAPWEPDNRWPIKPGRWETSWRKGHLYSCWRGSSYQEEHMQRPWACFIWGAENDPPGMNREGCGWRCGQGRMQSLISLSTGQWKTTEQCRLGWDLLRIAF